MGISLENLTCSVLLVLRDWFLCTWTLFLHVTFFWCISLCMWLSIIFYIVYSINYKIIFNYCHLLKKTHISHFGRDQFHMNCNKYLMRVKIFSHTCIDYNPFVLALYIKNCLNLMAVFFNLTKVFTGKEIKIAWRLLKFAEVGFKENNELNSKFSNEITPQEYTSNNSLKVTRQISLIQINFLRSPTQ